MKIPPPPPNLLVLVRALKLMDFQPYLGVVTRSLAAAALSLIHFFMLAFMVFICFSVYAYTIFGDVIDGVSGGGQKGGWAIATKS